MKQVLLFLALASGLALGKEHHNHHHEHERRESRTRSSRGSVRRSPERAKDVVESLPVASVTRCDSLPAVSHPPVQCQRGHHGPHLAQVFGNMCFALQSGFRERECTVMSPHHDAGHGHGHGHNAHQHLAKKQPPPGDRRHSMSADSSDSSDSSSSSNSRRATGSRHHHQWRSRALRDNVLAGTRSRRAQFCIALYNPVRCLLDGVEFPSRCDAVSAGYDEADCTVPTQPAASCPTALSNPVVCTDDAAFDNICLASEAGFVPSKDCVSANQPLFAETKCAGRRTKPVTCGTEQRVFSNICLARAAGFKRSNCERVPQEEPPV